MFVVKMDGSAVGSYETKTEADKALAMERNSSPARDFNRFTVDEHKSFDLCGTYE